jgi:tetratricopeptide (TPR) repeat protein
VYKREASPEWRAPAALDCGAGERHALPTPGIPPTEARLSTPSATDYEAMIEHARALYRADQFDEARHLLRDALALGERLFGANAIELVPALTWLAMAISGKNYARTDHEELLLHQRILAITEAACPLDDPRVAGALYDVALNLSSLGKREESLPLMTRAFDIASHAYDEGHYFVSQVRGALGSLLVEMNRAAEGIPLLQKEALLADAKGHAASRMVAHWFLGPALLRAERWDEAITSLSTSLQLAEAQPQGGGRLAEELRTWLDEARAGQKRPK